MNCVFDCIICGLRYGLIIPFVITGCFLVASLIATVIWNSYLAMFLPAWMYAHPRSLWLACSLLVATVGAIIFHAL